MIPKSPREPTLDDVAELVDLRTELPPFDTTLDDVQTGTAPLADVYKLERPASMIVMRKVL